MTSSSSSSLDVPAPIVKRARAEPPKLLWSLGRGEWIIQGADVLLPAPMDQFWNRIDFKVEAWKLYDEESKETLSWAYADKYKHDACPHTVIHQFGEHAVQLAERLNALRDGKVTRKFGLWLWPLTYALANKFRDYVVRMHRMAQIVELLRPRLHCGSLENLVSTPLAKLHVTDFINFRVHELTSHRWITRAAMSLIAIDCMMSTLPAALQTKTSMFYSFLRRTYTRKFSCTKQQAFAFVKSELVRSNLVAHGMRVAGSRIHAFLSPIDGKRCKTAFAKLGEIASSMSLSANSRAYTETRIVEVAARFSCHHDLLGYLDVYLDRMNNYIASDKYQPVLTELARRANAHPKSRWFGVAQAGQEVYQLLGQPAAAWQSRILKDLMSPKAYDAKVYSRFFTSGEKAHALFVQLSKDYPEWCEQYMSKQFKGTCEELIACIRLTKLARDAGLETKEAVSEMYKLMLDAGTKCSQGVEACRKKAVAEYNKLHPEQKPLPTKKEVFQFVDLPDPEDDLSDKAYLRL